MDAVVVEAGDLAVEDRLADADVVAELGAEVVEARVGDAVAADQRGAPLIEVKRRAEAVVLDLEEPVLVIGSATEAAEALKPIAGEAASLLLAVGLIGAGVLAVPILTGAAAYGVAETFGWKSGLDRTVKRAPQFYAVVIAATLVGMAINFLGINPICGPRGHRNHQWTDRASHPRHGDAGFEQSPGHGRAHEWLAAQRARLGNRARDGGRLGGPDHYLRGWVRTGAVACYLRR